MAQKQHEKRNASSAIARCATRGWLNMAQLQTLLALVKRYRVRKQLQALASIQVMDFCSHKESNKSNRVQCNPAEAKKNIGRKVGTILGVSLLFC